MPTLDAPREPILRPDDLAVWDRWQKIARMHARTNEHRRRVERARRLAAEAFEAAPSWCCMVSGGKDSTALAAIVADVAPGTPVASEKDDMDYPGEEDYVVALCARLGLPLTILRPPISPREVIAREASRVGIAGDWHGRAAELSRVCFYELVEAHGAAFDGILLGLRQEESRARRMNRASRGAIYQKRPDAHHPIAGQWVCAPLSDWQGIDVYAFCAARDLELLPVYRCVAFAHRDAPWRIRKSWWLPNGNTAGKGDVAWLRRYFPSLFAQLCAWMPDARQLT